MQDKKTKKSPRKILLTILFVAINIAVIAITAFSEFGNSENATKLSEVQFNFWYLIPAIVIFLVALYIEIHKFAMVTKKTCKLTTRAEIKPTKTLAALISLAAIMTTSHQPLSAANRSKFIT